jgi:3D (Asp-Asp-Asp) domain-containing protein
VPPIMGLWSATAHPAVDGHAPGFSPFQRAAADLFRTGRIPLQFGGPMLSMISPISVGIEILPFRLTPVRGIEPSTFRASLVGDQTGPEAIQAFKLFAGPVDKEYPVPSGPTPPVTGSTAQGREWRVRVERAAVPFTSLITSDPSAFKGSRVVRQSGVPGLEERTVRALYVNGHQVSAVSTRWLIVIPPVARVIALGTRANIASRGEFAGREFIVVDATAYYPGPRNFGGGVGPRTAIGIVAQRGVAAVDPSIIPLGTRLFIEGYGYAVAGDTGGAIQGMRIDLCYNSYDEAIHFGRQRVKVYILGRN